ncbi:hypothetical protein QAD02_010109 [Eretmocerus hayati]|uniref:Uncharacterized protein n=1 Tax=Eretmocerus hayati TaxID=131215 RepID=A0ACC2NC06_9HYME|nr:hypothetical protein QAD02_010109 [Eretmocerus hayati]
MNSGQCKSRYLKSILTRGLIIFCIIVNIHLQFVSASLLLPKKWEVTQIKSDELQYAWTIDDLHYEENGPEVCTKSLEFSTMSEDNQKWMLMACVSAIDTNIDNPSSGTKMYDKLQKISVSLFYLSGHPNSIESRGRLTVMNGAYDEIHAYSGDTTFKRRDDGNIPRYSGHGYLYREITTFTGQQNETPINELVIHVSMKIDYDNTRNFSSNECSVTSSATRKHIQSKYKNEYTKYQNGPLISIMTKDNQNTNLNRDVLRSHSPVSEQRFRDFNYDEVKEIINFLYTGGVPQTPEMTKKIFLIAKEFQLDELKELAEEQLCNSIKLNVSDMVEDLIFAEENDANTIKSRIVNYLATQPSNFLNIPVISQLKESQEDLFKEILETKSAYIDEKFVQVL